MREKPVNSLKIVSALDFIEYYKEFEVSAPFVFS